MSMDLPGQISACKRRIEILRVYIEKTKASGNTSSDAERQLALETELLRTLKAELATDAVLRFVGRK